MSILAGHIEGVIETAYCVATVGIAVSDADRPHMRRLSHDTRAKMLVEYRNGLEIGIRTRRVYENSLTRLNKSGAMGLVVAKLLSNCFSFVRV